MARADTDGDTTENGGKGKQILKGISKILGKNHENDEGRGKGQGKGRGHGHGKRCECPKDGNQPEDGDDAPSTETRRKRQAPSPEEAKKKMMEGIEKAKDVATDFIGKVFDMFKPKNPQA
jgi:hypothetical protein